MAVCKDLALNRGIFAARLVKQGRMPTRLVFDNPGLVHAAKLNKAGWGNEALLRMAERVFAAQDGGRDSEEMASSGGQG